MANTSNSLIRICNAWRTYDVGVEKVHALRDVSLTINRNDYVAIMGPSGSGKSTLMNLLGCLDSPTGGEYYLNDKLVSKMGDAELAHARNREIGFVFQTFNLLSRQTAQRNVELPLIYAGVPHSDRVKRAKEALDIVGLGDRMTHRPNELSGGQCQRVAIARALVSKPALLLADEPTGNLDTATEREILKLFDDLHTMGNTIIMVTHDAEVAEHAHRVVSILDGQIKSDHQGRLSVEAPAS